MDYVIKTMYSKEELNTRVAELAKQIDDDFKGEKIILIGLLRGSVIFLSDLCRHMDSEVKIDFMTVSSYGNDLESSRDVRILKDLDEDIRGMNVIIVEDIIDTGNTLHKVVEVLNTRSPKTLKICTLLDKPERREVDVDVDYVGFVIPDEFVVGYGIDYAQKHRTLPYVGHVVFNTEETK